MLQKIIQDLGHTIPEFPFDGKIHRFPIDSSTKLPLWVTGVEFEHTKKKIQYACYGNWKTGDSFKHCSEEIESAQFKSKLAKHIQVIDNAITEEKQRKNQECSDKYTEIFYEIPENTDLFDYMKSKNLTLNYSGRVQKNTLMIPVFNHDEEGNRYLSGVQKIYKAEQQGKYEKRFSIGIKKIGSYMMPVVQELSEIEYAYLCEGFATACSIHEATKHPVIACIDSGNMQACIANIRQVNPSIKLILCADDDFETKKKLGKNPGIDAVTFAAKTFTNVITRKPTFKARMTETDFNDLHVLEGLDAVTSQLIFDYSEFCDIEILGHEDHKKFFFFTTETLKTVEVSVSEMGPMKLKSFAPQKFWSDRYGYKKDKEGNQTDCPDWEKITDKVMAQARKKGFFSWKDVHGIGVWKEQDGRPVVNLGNRILDNGTCVDIGKFRSKLKYQSSAGIDIKTDGNTDIITPLKKLMYKHAGDHIILAGWCAIAPLFNMLDWRPHVWINGPRGSGKSKILELLSDCVWMSHKSIGSTAAGLRQKIKSNASPIMIDEAEPDSHDGRGRMSAIMEMIRHSSSNSGAESLRGSSNGDSYSLGLNSIFMLASVANSLDKKTDASRFLVVEMNDTKDQPKEDYKQILDGLQSIDSSSMMLRSLNQWPYIKKNIETIKDSMRGEYDSRQCDQIAPILAGYHSLLLGGLISEESIEYYLEQISHLKEYIEETSETEAEACVEAILDVIYEKSSGKTIGMAMAEIELGIPSDKLSHVGIRKVNNKEFYIKSKNENLSRELSGQFKKYSSFLKTRYERTNFRINNVSCKCYKVVL